MKKKMINSGTIAVASVMMLVMVACVGSAYLQQASAKEPDFGLNQQFHFNDNNGNGNDKTNCSIQTILPHTKTNDDTALFPHRETVEC
jgi:hypothetical protein